MISEGGGVGRLRLGCKEWKTPGSGGESGVREGLYELAKLAIS